MLNSTPAASELWQGIGGHFDNLSQVLCEFVDNSVSNIVTNNPVNRSVIIKFAPQNDQTYIVSVEDAGTGMINFEPIMKLGDKSNIQSPLNEHGFGLKHALATANPGNDNWRICTRTQNDLNNSQYREINAAYEFEYEELIRDSSTSWPGILSGTGTYIEFGISEELFYTLRDGLSGNAGFKKCLEYLAQDLGYIYSGMLNPSALSILIYTNDQSPEIIVQGVNPDWVDFYQTPAPGEVSLDLGNGNVEIEYKFGEIREGSSIKYYRRSMSSSGIEIRVNGRLLMGNLFKLIWGLENHPSYNHFLGQINIKSEHIERLPKTRTSKNGIRKEDSKLVELLKWIRRIYPEPEKRLTNSISEREFIRQLKDLKVQHVRSSSKSIRTDFTVYRNINSPVLVDLYLYDGNEVVLYEAKKTTADVQDFYQLLMYWDGLVSDSGSPNEGILLAPNFSPGVSNIVEAFNDKEDASGNKYNFSTKTWQEEGINYP